MGDIEDLCEADIHEIAMHILDIKKDLAYIKEKIDEQSDKFKRQEALNVKFVAFMNNIEFATKIFIIGGGSSLVSYLLYLYLLNLYR